MFNSNSWIILTNFSFNYIVKYVKPISFIHLI